LAEFNDFSNHQELVQETTEAPTDRWVTVKSALREVIETVLLTLLIFFLVRTLIQNFRIEGSSMEPNLHDGQYLIINKIVYRFHPPERGDIVVFQFPRNPQRDFIKRIIGLPGEKIEVRQGEVLINDQELEEPYAPKAGSYSWGPALVGENELFVLGDNRNNSSDSHSWGMLPRDKIVGKAWVSYWPPQHWSLIPHYSFQLQNQTAEK
jgi:signal peptidase I